MYKIAWFTLDWPAFWLVVAALACLFIAIKVASATGTLLLSLVLYFGFAWNPWFTWLPNLYWLAVAVGALGILWGLVHAGERSRSLATFGAGVALGLAFVLINSNVFGASPPQDREVPGITSQLVQIKEDMDDQQEQIDQLKRWTNRRIQQLEDQLYLQGQDDKQHDAKNGK